MASLLTSFDLPPALYAEDVRSIYGPTVKRFGLREWKMAVLTGEIHGHLGIYSTLGVKMGLRAREWFEAQGCKGEIALLSFAGSTPPVSCLNDGLQVSTGATVGHGLIRISDDAEKRVEAEFSCDGYRLSMALRPEFEAQIRSDIAEGVARYAHSPAYWEYIRVLALRYWSTWDRNEIFLIG